LQQKQNSASSAACVRAWRLTWIRATTRCKSCSTAYTWCALTGAGCGNSSRASMWSCRKQRRRANGRRLHSTSSPPREATEWKKWAWDVARGAAWTGGSRASQIGRRTSNWTSCSQNGTPAVRTRSMLRQRLHWEQPPSCWRRQLHTF
ncbi:hypothetical protein DUNSADRAFT_1726, partial [Dunaliella salina]